MPTRPDQFPKIAAKKSALPEVVRLFAALAIRAEKFAKMQDEFTESITIHREAREGRPVKLTRVQHRLMAEFEGDAEKAVQDMQRYAANMDDAALLTCALSAFHQQIQLDERLFSGWHEDDKPMARRLIEYESESMKLIQQFIEMSSFKDKVTSIWRDKGNEG